MKIDFREVIPAKYCISEDLLQEFRDFIKKYMPPKKTGRPRVDNDSLIAGIYYLLKTGCQWDALPLCFGSPKTVYHRFVELVAAGVFQKIWRSVLIKYNQKKGLSLHEQSVDSMHKKSPLGGEKTGISPVDRRKLGTKVGLVVEEIGLPIGLIVERANKHDSQLFCNLLDDLQNQIPQSKNHYLRTDKGFVSRKNRLEAISRNFTPVMPIKKPKNKPSLQPQKKDEKRWVVERTFSWLNRFRRVFVRYERRSRNFLALIQFACQIIVINKI
jgi:putative transposase